MILLSACAHNPETISPAPVAQVYRDKLPTDLETASGNVLVDSSDISFNIDESDETTEEE